MSHRIPGIGVAAAIALVFSPLPGLVAPSARAQDAKTSGISPETVARMQQVIQSFVADRTFMGTVLVAVSDARGDRTLIDQGYGSADLEWNIPNTPAVRFRLGSLTKQFTAASILLLEERGKLKTDDLISKYLPDLPPAWDKITIYHLLTHTSGIPNFTAFPDYSASEAKETTPAALVDRFRNKPLDFEPGTKFSYSNSGYVLLGYLLEKIAGQTYESFLQQNLFTPLGMAHTGVDNNAAILPQRAQGYVPGAHGMEHAGYISMTIPFSAGALYSTTGDLLKWEQGLFGGKLLSPASLTRMTTPFKDGYACGLFVVTLDGHVTEASHGGGIEGFNTSMAFYPDSRLAVIVLANLNGSAADQIGDDLGRLARGGQVTLPSERKIVAVPLATLQEYAGTYQLSPTFSITMIVEGGQLMTQGTGQPKAPLFASSPTRFFLKVVSAEIEFARDPATHVVNRLTLFQGGQGIEARKQ